MLLFIFHWMKASRLQTELNPAFFVIKDYQTNRKVIQVHSLMFIHITLEKLVQLQQDLQITGLLLRESKVNTFSVFTELTTQVYVVQLSVFFL